MHIFRRDRSGTAPAAKPSSHQTVRLSPGRHRGPDEAVCVMELASMLAGERFSDHPRSVCPTIAALLRAYNDALDADSRQDLYRFASEAVGTRAGYELAERRARFVLAWARSRQYSRRRWLKLLRGQAPPRRDAAPTEVAEYVLRSLNGRDSVATHAAMLGLLDWIIAMKSVPSKPSGTRRVAREDSVRLAPQDSVQAPLERTGEQLAHRPRLEALNQG
jgi:hypothetical protein